MFPWPSPPSSGGLKNVFMHDRINVGQPKIVPYLSEKKLLHFCARSQRLLFNMWCERRSLQVFFPAFFLHQYIIAQVRLFSLQPCLHTHTYLKSYLNSLCFSMLVHFFTSVILRQLNTLIQFYFFFYSGFFYWSFGLEFY